MTQMKQLSPTADKFAIVFSAMCVIHCLALPLLLIFIPSMASLPLNQEAFHTWMVVAVIPTSAYALTLGCKAHKKASIAIYGVLGLCGLIGSVLLGEHYLGELGEKVLTVVSTAIVAYAHVRNFKLCQTSDKCHC